MGTLGKRMSAIQAALYKSNGVVTPGNIDLHKRPIVQNPDGSISTVRSISVTDDAGRGILLPTVSPDGRILSNPDALKLYRQTGQHLGIFKDEDSANRYSETLHNQQAAEYLPKAVAQKQAAARRPVAPRLGTAQRAL